MRVPTDTSCGCSANSPYQRTGMHTAARVPYPRVSKLFASGAPFDSRCARRRTLIDRYHACRRDRSAFRRLAHTAAQPWADRAPGERIHGGVPRCRLAALRPAPCLCCFDRRRPACSAGRGGKLVRRRPARIQRRPHRACTDRLRRLVDARRRGTLSGFASGGGSRRLRRAKRAFRRRNVERAMAEAACCSLRLRLSGKIVEYQTTSGDMYVFHPHTRRPH